MSHFLRVVKRLSVRVASSSNATCGCQSPILWKDGIYSFSTRPSTKIEPYARFRRRRGKKKMMTDREALQEQLTRTLDAHLVQLNSSGSSTNSLHYRLHGNALREIHRPQGDTDLVGARTRQGEPLSGSTGQNNKDESTENTRWSSKHSENENHSIERIVDSESNTNRTTKVKDHGYRNQKDDISYSNSYIMINSEFSERVQKAHFEQLRSQDRITNAHDSISEQILPIDAPASRGTISSHNNAKDATQLTHNEIYDNRLEHINSFSTNKSTTIKTDNTSKDKKRKKTKSVISDPPNMMESVINPTTGPGHKGIGNIGVNDKKVMPATNKAVDKVKGKKKKRKSSEIYERKNEIVERNQKSLQEEKMGLMKPYSFDPNTFQIAKQVFKYIPEKKVQMDMNSFAGSRADPSEGVMSAQTDDIREVEELEIQDEASRALDKCELDADVLEALENPGVQGKLMSPSEVRQREQRNDPFHEDDQFDVDMFDEDYQDTNIQHLESASIEGFITKKAKDKYTAKMKQRKERLLKQQKDKVIKVNLPANQLTEEAMELKRERFNMDLLAYVDACVMCGLTRRALQDIQYYRPKARSNRALTPEINNVDIYNTLLRGLVKEGCGVEDVRKVFSYIKEDKLQPTMETFAICLASVGNQTAYDTMLATFIVKDMRKQGLEVEDIFNQCTFLHNERHVVYKVLKAVMPNFTPNPPKVAAKFETTLVESLNSPLPLGEVVEVNPSSGSLSQDSILQKAELQFERELDGYVSIDSIMKVKEDKNHHHVEQLREKWRTDIKQALEKRVEQLELKSVVKQGINVHPFFCLFPLDDYVTIVLNELEQLALLSQYQSPPVSYLRRRLADQVFLRYKRQQLIHSGVFPKLYKAYSAYIEHLMNPYQPLHNQRHLWSQLVHNLSDGNSMEIPEKPWSTSILKQIGQELLDIVMTTVEVDGNLLDKDVNTQRFVKCFYLVQRPQKHKMTLQIKPHPILCQLFNAKSDIVMPTEELPMLCPPIPYTSVQQGCNFSSTVQLVRYCVEQQIKQLEKGDAAMPMLDALNVVSACAWRINKPILDVVLKMFRTGGNPDLSVPLLPSKLQKPEKPENMDSPAEKKQYYKEVDAYRKALGETVSLWWADLYRLSIANRFKDDVLWFPLNMDFRGRTYPIAPHLNHQGRDVIRGMMLFAKGKPLGEKGLDWLKIHLVNLTSLKKRASNEDRLAYADEIMPDIMDSADNPLTGNRWWMTSDEPWQTLGACIEITAAIRSGDPSTFISHLPVHQDGSCNGLQHYAALGRDEKGAKSVNLYPLDTPADVYSEVVDLVQQQIARDVADTSEQNSKTRETALIASEYLERKVIKQSIMTTVYGVTLFGANLQIRRQLEDKEMPEEHMHAVSAYLTKNTFKCLDQMFTSAKAIERWFGSCTMKISSVGEPTEWVTPLNFPVIQPYFKVTKRFTDDEIQSQIHRDKRKPHRQKQKNGFAPNFVHSLDATHMALTALYCYRKGITFTSVHDCFWTHPCDVATMNKITREQFLALHSEPILQNLSSFFINRFIHRDSMSQEEVSALQNTFSSVPERGAFELEKVLDSTYFFS